MFKEQEDVLLCGKQTKENRWLKGNQESMMLYKESGGPCHMQRTMY